MKQTATSGETRDKKVMTAVNRMFGFDSSTPSRRPSRAFGISLPFSTSLRGEKAVPARMSLSDIKLKMELSLQDVQGATVERLRYKIRAVREVKELWLLRSDVHQLLSKEVNQAAAAQAINDMLPCFLGWLPERQLVKI